MANKLRMKIPIVPEAKLRPRLNRRTGTIYTPSKTQNYQTGIREQWMRRFPKLEPMKGPVGLDLTFTMPRPKYMFKKRLPMPAVPHTHPPDWDNLGKAVTDSLNHIAFIDDSQLWDVHVRKLVAAGDGQPGIDLKLWED